VAEGEARGEDGVGGDGVGKGEAEGAEVGEEAVAEAIGAEGGEGVGDAGIAEGREGGVVAEAGVMEESVGRVGAGEAGDFEELGGFEDFAEDSGVSAGIEDEEAGLLHEAEPYSSRMRCM